MKPRLKCPTCNEFTVKVRRDVARSVIAARQKIDALRRKARSLERSLKNTSEDWVEYHSRRLRGMVDINHYPMVPPGTILPTRNGEGLPYCSGIYFLWSGETVEYVGKSTNISRRLRLPRHSYLREDDLISFIPFKQDVLDWAECYYIGLLRPPRNFNLERRRHREKSHAVALATMKGGLSN